MKIQKVIEKTNQLLKDSRYSESRIHMYNWLWKKGILKYMETRGLIEFDDQTGRDCMLAFHDNNSMTLHHRDLFKSVDVLINVLLNGTLGGRMHIPVQYPLRGSIGAAAESYFVYQKNHGLKDKTIRCKRRRLSDFIEFLYEYGTHQLPDIDTRCLAAFFENRKYRHRDYFTAVRAFIKYLYKKGIIEKDSSYALYSIGKDIMHVKVPSFYNEDEIRQLEKSISPTSNVGKATKYVDEVQAFIIKHQLESRVRFMHNIPNEDLPAIYQLASVFVYPSRYEGFGLPVIEGIQSGLPVVACTGSCLEEAGGPDNLYVAPDDDEGMANGIALFLGDASFRQQSIGRSMSYVKRFENQDLAHQMLQEYQKLI
ncbi:MAG: glycosyltransferase [Bacilli bacterium]